MKVLILAASVSLACAIPAARAGEGHDHNHEAAVEAAPKGGILRNAGDYKSEIVLNKDQVKIFVYDKAMKPVLKDKLHAEAKGEVAFPKDKKKKPVTFKLSGDSYEAKIEGIEKVHRYDLHVTLTIGGKPVFADFGVDNIH